MGGWVKAKSGVGKKTEGGRRDIGIRRNRINNIKPVARILVSPFGVYPSLDDD